MFDRQNDYFKEKGAEYTASEIFQQPECWKKAVEIVKDNKEGLKSFFDKVLSDDYEIIFTGAGTSEFVGNSIFPFISSICDFKVKSYGTTDIVASPYYYLHESRNTLMVSFARSGNSPESVAAVEIANKVCKNIYHLFITCNKEGKLNKFGQNHDNCYVLNMPEETNDNSFAMTSSYSSMYLSAVVSLLQYKDIPFEEKVNEIISNTAQFMEKQIAEKIVDEFDYNRIVYLGSNCLKGVSQESALKTCELTAGTIMTTYDSTMGFRHGPKSVVKPDSLTVVYVSDDEYTRKYDTDIIKEIYGEHIGKLLVVSSQYDESLENISDYYISFNNKEKLDSVYLGLEYITVGQLLGMFKSIKMNNTPDNPCSTGQVSRVVHGVYIYEY